MIFGSGRRQRSSLPAHSQVIFESVTNGLSTNQQFVGINTLKYSDIWTAVRILASDIATYPIQPYVDNKASTDVDLYRLLNIQPNSKMNAFHFKFALAANLLLNGNSYARVVRKGGKVERLDFIPPSAMQVFQDDYNIEYRYTPENGKTYVLNNNEVLHFKYMTTDGLIGMSPLFALQQELSMQKHGNNALSSFFKRGILGSGVLKVNKGELNKESKEIIRRTFEEANTGEGNIQRTLIMDSTMDYVPIEVNTEVLKLVNSNQYSTKQIAKAFGIPLDKFGMELVNTATQVSNQDYLQSTLTPYFNVFTSELNVKLADNSTPVLEVFKFNTDEGVSQQTLIQVLTKGGPISSAVTINEARAKMGLGPVEGGDKLISQTAPLKGGEINGEY